MRPNAIERCFLVFWTLLLCVYDGDATLKTTFVEDVCSYKNTFTFDLKYQNAGILMSAPHASSSDCRITLSPRYRHSVVLSIYRYDLSPEDQLIIEDADHHKIGLIGWAQFPSEKKAVISEGYIAIHFKINNTNVPDLKRGFQFTFTEVHDIPCASNEFQCKNNKCIPNRLLCNGHNHCGDNSDNENCVPKGRFEEQPPVTHDTYLSKVMIISIGVAAAILLIIVVVFVVVLARNRQKRPVAADNTDASNNTNTNNNLQSVSATVPSSTDHTLSNNVQPEVNVGSPQFQSPNSFFNHVRRSLRGLRAPKKENMPLEERKPETYQVPSMYPNLDQLPSAPTMEGIENANFHIEE
ncbi:uncharacterized protein LOC129224626 [Uloborus diversus]|uniref:uncharacterized protein LOC129224626 n=1 Tax=Uloborus diversus TaxID=327109 RepID=UPI002409CBB1|nr:uncharacterized protein LOC129224626 [Uloborus diversus]